MRDKRSRQRRNSPHRINVLRGEDDAVLGRLVNISVGGLMYLGRQSQSMGKVMQLRLPLPTMASGKTSIEVEGKVVWCREDDNPRYQRIGVEFVNLGAQEGYIIETVLQRLHLVG
jgi:hypothetical protein